MKRIAISDVTMKQSGKNAGVSLSFREKIELAKQLDRLGVCVIETIPIVNVKIDSLLIKSIASSVKHSIVAVPTGLEDGSAELAWNALREAKHPRLQVCAPVSAVQMEYLAHKKPAAMLTAISECVAKAKTLCADVEFVADDATRADPVFLYSALAAAVDAGAGIVTVCDTAGTMLPTEFSRFIGDIFENVPQLADVTLGVGCSNELSMADSCAIAAIRAGAGEVKAASYCIDTASVENLAKILSAKGTEIGADCTVHTTQMHRILSQIAWMFESSRSKNSPFDNGVQDNSGLYLTAHDDMSSVLKVVMQLGYDLSEEDGARPHALQCVRRLLGVLDLPSVPSSYRSDCRGFRLPEPGHDGLCDSGCRHKGGPRRFSSILRRHPPLVLQYHQHDDPHLVRAGDREDSDMDGSFTEGRAGALPPQVYRRRPSQHRGAFAQ